MKNRIITVHGSDVTITTRHEQDYISLTDMAKRFGDESILYSWLRNRNTVQFLGVWEQMPLNLSNSRGLKAKQV